MPSLLDVFDALAHAAPSEERRFAEHVAPVGESDDLARVLALPRRLPPSFDEQKVIAAEMTQRLRRDNPKCNCARLRPEVVARGQNPCITELRPLQGWLLHEASQTGGALGLLPIGAGKTGLDALLAMVVPNCKLALLMLRPSEVEQFNRDFACWSQHFTTPNLVDGPGGFVPGRPALELFPYSKLSQQAKATYLTERGPDVIIADEVQALKARKASRTGRLLRYFASAPGTRFFCHSGSITTRGLDDFAHLLAVALRQGSPLPLHPGVIEVWAEAVDPNQGGAPADAGALYKLCAPGESLRQALNRRIVETKGVVATSDASVDAKLVFKEAPAEAPADVKRAVADVYSRAQRPDGEELVDELEVARVAAQVAAGLFYYWAFPRGEPAALIDEWFNRRQEWNREVRDQLKYRREGIDSPGLLQNAAERAYGVGKMAASLGPKWHSDTFRAWRAIEAKVVPDVRVKWISTYLAEAAAKWAAEEPSIVWYGLSAFGRKLAELGGFACFGAGEEASRTILDEKGDRSIVASIRAHGTGKNLQSFWRTLIANPPADGGIWEQCIGRTHRYGQSRSVVEAWIYRHMPEFKQPFAKAREFARYAQEITGTPQRLLYGEYSWDSSGANDSSCKAESDTVW